MRRISTAITAGALALSMTLGLSGPAQAAPAGYDSAYQFESAFLNLNAGDSGTFSVFFANTGTTAWVKGSGSQVNLAICGADKVSCSVTSAQAAWAVNWLSSTAYATATKDTVVPGDFSAFTYNIKVPAGTAGGTYRFNGDLVQASSGTRVHPEGYYQDATVGAAPAAAAGITCDLPFSSSQDSEVSSSVPGIGQKTITCTVSGLTGTVDIAVSGTTTNSLSGGGWSFLDDTGDKKADSLCSATSFITAINGTAITQATCVADQPIPADGKLAITIDSATRNQRVRVIVWQDKSNNGQVDLSTAGAAPTTLAGRVYGTYDSANDGVLVASGRTYFMGSAGNFGTQFAGNTNWNGAANTCTLGGAVGDVTAGVANSAPVYRLDSANKTFSAGPTGGTSNRFTYDANDVFRVNGVQVTMDQFKSSLNADSTGVGDAIAINYSPDAAGISEFNITCNTGANAPATGVSGSLDITVAIGNFDNGTAAEDVQVTLVVPDHGDISSYQIQRANGAGGTTADNGTTCTGTSPVSSAYTTIGSLSPDGTQGTFTDFDRPGSSTTNRTFCYRVRTQDPTTAAEHFSNVVGQTVGAATGDTARPTSSFAALTTSSGFANTLDSGDKLVFTFNEAMSIAANAVIRVTDGDCGSWTQNGATQTPGCTGAQTNTVADIICGTNATCQLDSARNNLTVTLTANPTIVAAGSVAGAQYPVNVTDSSGITDTSGNTWDLTSSTDRVIP